MKFKKMLSAWLQAIDHSYTYKDNFFDIKKFYNACNSPAITYHFGKHSHITVKTLSQWS